MGNCKNQMRTTFFAMGAILMAYADALRITSDAGEIYEFAQQDGSAPIPAVNEEATAKPAPAPKPSVDPVPEQPKKKEAPAPKPSVDPVPAVNTKEAKKPAPKPSVDPVPELKKKEAKAPVKKVATETVGAVLPPP